MSSTHGDIGGDEQNPESEQRRIGGRREVVEKIIAQGISADSLPFRPAFDGSAWLSDGFIRRSLFLLQSRASSAI